MEPLLEIATVRQEHNPERIELYLCFNNGDGTYESHLLSVEGFLGDTKSQFADSLENLAKKLRAFNA